MTVDDALAWADQAGNAVPKHPVIALAAEVRRLRAMLDVPTDARDLVITILQWMAPYKPCEERHIEAGISQVAAYRARLLDEAAERAVAWLIEQTSHIDPAIAATNSGKWLIKLREKQTVQLRAAVRGEGER